MYESLIQGQTLYKPPYLINPDGEGAEPEYTYEIRFDKPLSLFSLKLDLIFDANPHELRKLLPKKQKKEIKKEEKSKEKEEAKSEKYIPPSDPPKKDVIDLGDEKCIPLIVHSYVGCAFNANSQLSKLVSDDKRVFAANYAGSHFIFTHQFGKRFIIDQFTVMSENSSQIGAYPMGAGILFISDTLAGLENTDPFHSFTLKDYVDWKDKRMYDPRPLQPYEPVGYFDFGKTTKIVDKRASKVP